MFPLGWLPLWGREGVTLIHIRLPKNGSVEILFRKSEAPLAPALPPLGAGAHAIPLYYPGNLDSGNTALSRPGRHSGGAKPLERRSGWRFSTEPKKRSEPFWVGIHIDNHRSGGGQRRKDCRPDFLRTADMNPDPSADICIPGKVRVKQIRGIIRVIFHHLFDLDHTQLPGYSTRQRPSGDYILPR